MRHLGSHLRLERAVEKRVRLAQVTAVLGVPVWFAALLALPRLLFAFAMTAFATGAVALGLAIVREARCRRRMGTMASRVRIEPGRRQDQGE